MRHTTFLEKNSFPARKDPIQCSIVLVNVGCTQVNEEKWAILKHQCKKNLKLSRTLTL